MFCFSRTEFESTIFWLRNTEFWAMADTARLQDEHNSSQSPPLQEMRSVALTHTFCERRDCQTNYCMQSLISAGMMLPLVQRQLLTCLTSCFTPCSACEQDLEIFCVSISERFGVLLLKWESSLRHCKNSSEIPLGFFCKAKRHVTAGNPHSQYHLHWQVIVWI